MPSSTILLLKTFLKSTSEINVLKHSQDTNKRKYAKNSLVGKIAIGIILMIYAVLTVIGLALTGLAQQIPYMCAEILFAVPFVFTLFKANGYLFGFKEYDMIMSMPFSVKSIVAGKFGYMYCKSFSMYALISLSMLIGYEISVGFHVLTCISWILMTFIIPICPMVIASAIGAVAVRLSLGFKYKNIVQAVFIAVLTIPFIFSRFFIENTIANDDLDNVMNMVSDAVQNTAKYVPFAKWFGRVITENAIVPFLLIILFNIVIFEVFFACVSKFYRRMNSGLTARMNRKVHKVSAGKQKSIVQSIAFKEFKRMTGSTIYLTNAGMGMIIITVLSIAMLFMEPEAIINAMMQGAPMTPYMIFPAIPVFIYMFLGMVPTTCCSPSLEGKNYWIMQTLPIEAIDDCKGKILYNLYLTIPFGVFAAIAASFCFDVSFFDGLLSVAMVVSMCIFSSIYGLRSGLKHRRLDWENEIEVVKQGMAVGMYILFHIIICVILLPLVVVVNVLIENAAIIMLVITLIAWILIFFSWKSVKKYA